MEDALDLMLQVLLLTLLLLLHEVGDDLRRFLHVVRRRVGLHGPCLLLHVYLLLLLLELLGYLLVGGLLDLLERLLIEVGQVLVLLLLLLRGESVEHRVVVVVAAGLAVLELVELLLELEAVDELGGLVELVGHLLCLLLLLLLLLLRLLLLNGGVVVVARLLLLLELGDEVGHALGGQVGIENCGCAQIVWLLDDVAWL